MVRETLLILVMETGSTRATDNSPSGKILAKKLVAEVVISPPTYFTATHQSFC